MTQQAQAEALLIEAWLRKSNEEAMAWRLDAADAIERLHAWVQEQQKSMNANQIELGEKDANLQKLNADLVAEASRTAAEKLRADQMSQQHDTQAAMNREARHKLAQLEAQKAVQMPEPIYTLRVRGRLHDHTPGMPAFDLPDGEHKLYTEQQVRAMVTGKREHLTDEQIKRIDDSTHFHESFDWNVRFARAIEKAHGIGVDNG